MKKLFLALSVLIGTIPQQTRTIDLESTFKVAVLSATAGGCAYTLKKTLFSSSNSSNSIYGPICLSSLLLATALTSRSISQENFNLNLCVTTTAALLGWFAPERQ